MRIGKHELMKILIIDESRLSWYMKKGLLPLSKKFDLNEAIKLHVEYEIEYHGNKLKAFHDAELQDLKANFEAKSNKRSNVQHTIKGDARDRKDEADALQSELKAEKLELELDEKKGMLISSEEVDVAMAELASQLITGYKNDLRVLPDTLQSQDKNTIFHRLDKHFDKRIEGLKKLLTFDPDNKNKLHYWDVMQLVHKILINNNGDVDEVMGLLNNGR